MYHNEYLDRAAGLPTGASANATPWRWGYGWNEWPRDYEKLPQGRSITTILEKLDVQKTIEDQTTDQR